MSARVIKELLDSYGDDGEHIIVKIEVNDVLETEPLGVIEAATLLENERFERGCREEEPYVFAYLPFLWMRGDVLVLTDLIFDFGIEPELFLDDTRDAQLRRRIFFDVPLREGPSAEHVVHEREIVLPIMLSVYDSATHLLKRELFALHLPPSLFILARFAKLFID